MLFPSFPFLFLFLPVLVWLWKLAAGEDKSRLSVLLLGASLLFGACQGLEALLLLLGLSAVNYLFGLLLADEGHRRRRLGRRGLLLLAVLLNVLVWSRFRHLPALSAWLAQWQDVLPVLAPAAMPAGFSFAVLIQLAWLLGVYQRRIRPGGIVRQALFTTCFPYALSGPLVRYEETGPQFDALDMPRADDLARGLGLLVLGLAKKVLLADSLAPAADAVFHAAAQGLPLSTAEAWLGALSYTFQIYFDFSGYTDMAVGAALMLGLRLPENFAAPYRATGIVDFWRRWHMTLGRWLHDCLYLPLGGSRHGRVRQYANLLLTMLVCGVWHGAGLTFLLWGALHGLLLLVNHAFRHLLRGSLAERVLALPPLRALCVLVTFLCLTAAWVLFRAGDTGTALHVWQSMFLWSDGHPLPLQQGLEALLPGGLLEPRLLLPLLAVCAVIVWALPCSQHVMLGRADGSRPRLHWQPTLPWAVALALPALASLLLMQGHAFLSFRF
ncbi:MBOAT family O-acyltransferase [Desulfovibrio piger]|uniref:Probable poly(Beta-D-mannuronate) O-acetylase n=1 Tax=Desulfovibrio piger TaxID=901 RepID=A0A1K1LFK8_9BACT|nr:MBOAT family O-acyltransferase [Desulfovibrio piger]SFV73480.1 Probable poly(beta-D-mannuronate) O-acetylase [Desulfovibrio piger]